ncbi:MAG: translation initiation factor IF-2, partial [Phycisphaerae bacterium]
TPAQKTEIPVRPSKRPKRRPAEAAEAPAVAEVEEVVAPVKGHRRGARKETEEEEAAGRRRAQAFRRHERQRQREDQEILDQVFTRGGDTGQIVSERIRVGASGRPLAPRVRRPAPPLRPAATEGPRQADMELPITVRNLSAALGIKASDIIRRLMDQGVLATVNDVLPEATAQEIAAGLDIELTVRRERAPEEVIAEIESRQDDESLLVPRPPVVTFLGHVDHGKTSLMDYIRKTRVVEGEAGGITQHIGAYRVPVGERWVTFLDTPGHEAFTAMRARGAQVTDIVVLVIAGDDGVMPQTEEAINHAKAAGVPIVVAINKCDLPQANPQRVKEQLTQFELVAEEWGGKTICVNTSAVTGENIDALLESLLLEAELLELKANPQSEAIGTVIEAELTEGLGPVATLLVQNGTLRAGDVVLAGTAYGRVRALKDETGRHLREASPTVPVRVAGLSAAPEAGERFYTLQNLAPAKEIAEERERASRESTLVAARQPRTLEAVFEQMTAEEVKELPIILKADVQGSVEAIRENLEKIEHPEVRVRVLHAGVGGVNESDVLLADASNAIILGFNAVPDTGARTLAEERGVDIRHYNIIYRITEDIRKALEGLLTPQKEERRLGEAQVLEIFKISRAGTIAGCRVTDGTIARNARLRIIRDGLVVHEGGIDSLRRVKDDVREVRSGLECGIRLAGYNDVKVGDRLEAFETVTVQRTLEQS